MQGLVFKKLKLYLTTIKVTTTYQSSLTLAKMEEVLWSLLWGKTVVHGENALLRRDYHKPYHLPTPEIEPGRP